MLVARRDPDHDRQAVLRIRIRCLFDPWIRCLFDPWIRDPE
jgi:hypothetical protein